MCGGHQLASAQADGLRVAVELLVPCSLTNMPWCLESPHGDPFLFLMELSIPITVADMLSDAAKAAASGAAGAAVRESFSAVKSLWANRFRRKAALEAVEEDPNSAPMRAALAHAVAQTGALNDPEFHALLGRLVEALAALPQAEAAAAGLDIDNLRAASVRFKNIEAAGTAVRIRNTAVEGSFEAEGIRGGVIGPAEKN